MTVVHFTTNIQYALSNTVVLPNVDCFACVCVDTRVCVDTCMWLYMHTSIHACITSMHWYMHVLHASVDTCMCWYMHVLIDACVDTCTCWYMHVLHRQHNIPLCQIIFVYVFFYLLYINFTELNMTDVLNFFLLHRHDVMHTRMEWDMHAHTCISNMPIL